MKFKAEIKSPVFHIKTKNPLCADENDDVLSIFIPSIEFAEELSSGLLRSIAKHKKLKAEGKNKDRISFTFTGDLLLPPIDTLS